MSRARFTHRSRTIALVALLILECLLVAALRMLGWFRTGDAILLLVCALVTAAPLLGAITMLAANRFRFSMRSALFAVALVAVFLTISMRPLIDYRSARSVSAQLLSANATLNKGANWKYYESIGLTPPPATTTNVAAVPLWLAPFTKESAAIPPDDSVRSIAFNNDRQIEIFADNWQRFSSLQSVCFTPGVTAAGLQRVETIIPGLEHLHEVVTSSVVPPSHWYTSLANIRDLRVMGERMLQGQPFPGEHILDIANLPNLEVLWIHGWGFTDADAQTLSRSPSLRRIIFRRTKVTSAGESSLSDDSLDRKVYRN